jgi:hypothetical protein
MPIRIGNVLQEPLLKLYFENEMMLALRDRTRVSAGCETCSALAAEQGLQEFVQIS